MNFNSHLPLEVYIIYIKGRKLRKK